MLSSEQITKEEAIALIVERASESYAPIVETNDAETVSPEALPTAAGEQGVMPTGLEVSETSEGFDSAIVESNPTEVEIIAELYVLRAHFANQLEGLRQSAIVEFSGLTEGQKTESKKIEIGMNYLSRAGALEAECDALMDNLITRLRNELENSGGDTSIINDILSSYVQEKSLTKAYYMSLYS